MNNNWKPFVLTLLVIGILLALFHIPRFSILGHEMRRVNILSEIGRLTADGRLQAEVYADSIDGFVEEKLDSNEVKVQHVAYVDSVPEGMTAIEDFGLTDDEASACMMDAFYAALSQTGERPVRIAYFGDSYIEGDILTAHLRDRLQQIFGGCGVGFVDIHSETAGFRTTVAAKASGWISHNVNDERSRHFSNALQGINGRYYIPSGVATMELRCTPGRMGVRLSKAEQATVYYTSGAGMQLMAAVNGGEWQPLSLTDGTPTITEEIHTVKTLHVDTVYTTETADSNDNNPAYTLDTTYQEREVVVRMGEQAQGSIEHKTVKGDIVRFKISISSGESSRFYGVALDGERGIALDNFSMRGSNGWHLSTISEETLKAFARQRPYDLIILHYGLNVANDKQVNYSGYTQRMKQSIEHLRAAFPKASILVISVADRDEKAEDGQMHTMRGVQELVQYQRKMAADTHVAFWNLFQAMGGNGSVAAMVEKKQANLDYTHINFAGGRHLASLLFDVLMNGKENYDKRMQ